MIQGIVDRIEGEYAVVEFVPESGDIFTFDIHLDNLEQSVKEGDILKIYSVNHIDFSSDNTCVYMELSRAATLKIFLRPLGQKTNCNIVIDKKLTQERSQEMSDLIASIFNQKN